ncbi:Predicted arabinose efflux permease, MFS family [Jatrophihabitans endophyticus]|uniref:Predicted arabinose efflux permease, MFS family n=1 Tax=Jatrophihabitans endophyticus TaxID=1206085 RepID=A0A1M5U9E0_9ACTN|nr:MFS transporter [Jatrophihabitans endophyticus]SHH59476.1 Predicted arabinose efflux permease, MFS family [Jatrophihabitans endophyticus]
MRRARVPDDSARVGLGRLVRNRTFLPVYIAEAQSLFGDQLARVALAVLVFSRTGSTPATAVVYAATFVPAVFGGMVLGRLGDRWPRRTTMVACDAARALCFFVMVLTSTHFAVVLVLVVVAVAVGPVFSAAQLSLLAARLPPDEFATANALRLVTSQAAQVGGFAAGGVLVAVLDPAGALAMNAATFALSSVLVWLFVALDRRDSVVGEPAEAADALPGAVGDTDASVRREAPPDSAAALWRNRRLRVLLGLSLCIGFFVVPEGLAVPFAAHIGATTGQAGLLLAAGALGGAGGAALLLRMRPGDRARAVPTMAIGCGLPLVLSAVLTTVTDAWWVAGACWLASGGFAAYVVQTTSELVQAIPDERRAHLVGVVSALTLAVQGVGVVVFGVVGQWTTPPAAVGIAGAVGAALVAALVAQGRHGR